MNTTMSREELIRQYDRFIDQVRTEVKDLYWLYNFFFFVDSALLGSIFFGKVNMQFTGLIEIVGIFLSLYWCAVLRKQRMWRDDWVGKIQVAEEHLGYETKFHMWKKKTPEELAPSAYLFGKRGLWKWLFLLPVGFTVLWILIFIGRCSIVPSKKTLRVFLLNSVFHV